MARAWVRFYNMHVILYRHSETVLEWYTHGGAIIYSYGGKELNSCVLRKTNNEPICSMQQGGNLA